MTDRELKCTYCQYTATSMAYLESHLESHRGEKLFQCRFCNYTTKYCGNRIVHERRMHLNKKPYTCKYCSYATVQSSTLHKHVAVHHSEMCTYKCPQCKFSCDDEKRYSKHLVKHHTEVFTQNLREVNTQHKYPAYRENSEPQEVPSQALPDASGDVPEIKVESQENADCNESSTEKMNTEDSDVTVRETDQQNNGEIAQRQTETTTVSNNPHQDVARPVISFNSGSGPSNGLKSPKLYKCRYCEYSTRFATNRLIHERRHLGKKPYMCKYCDYAATQSTTLKSHLRQKHSQAFEKYHCNMCQFECVLEEVFMKHLRDFHSDTAAVIDPNVSQAETVPVSSIVRSPYAISNVPATYSMAGMNAGHQNMPMTSTPNTETTYRTASASTSVSDYFAEFNSLLNQTRQDTDPNTLGAGELPSGESNRTDNAADGVAYPTSLPAIYPKNREQQSNVQACPPRNPANKGLFPVSLQSGDSRVPVHHRGEHRTGDAISSTSGASRGTQTLLVLHDISTVANKKRSFQCQHCDIIFPDNVLFTIHRGFHGYEKPFQCNVCGYDCGDKYEFASHSHSCMP